MLLVAMDNMNYDAWLATHDAQWCHRYHSRITAEACRGNRALSTKSNGDARCFGCGGLDNQPDPQEWLQAVSMALDGDLTHDLTQALQDVLDGIEETAEEPAVAGDFFFPMEVSPPI